MSDTGLTIDATTFADNPAAYQVEFAGNVDGELQPFAVRYSALEALAGRPVVDDLLAVAQSHLDLLSVSAGKALARGSGGGTGDNRRSRPAIDDPRGTSDAMPPCRRRPILANTVRVSLKSIPAAYSADLNSFFHQ